MLKQWTAALENVNKKMFPEAVEADLQVQDALWGLPEILLQINVILQAVKLL